MREEGESKRSKVERKFSMLSRPCARSCACPVCTNMYSSVLSREHLEAELLVVLSSGEALPSLKPLLRKGLHLERVNRHSEFSRTLLEAFNQAHFSIIVVRLWGEEGGGGGGEGGGGGSKRHR